MVAFVVLLTLALVLTGCSSEQDGAGAGAARTAGVTSTSGAAPARPTPAPAGLAGMPPVLDPATSTRPPDPAGSARSCGASPLACTCPTAAAAPST
jgi:hypothetical protein